MDEVLKDTENADSFVDDVCVYDGEFADMMRNLKSVLDEFRNANLQMRVNKCKFGYIDIDFVGYHISRDGISPITENISAILAVQIPTDLPSLTRFLGMANNYRDFVLQMSSIAEPLNKLRQDGRPFKWTEECENAFKSIKEKLASPPVLAYPDWSQPFYLEADASKSAIGGVLSQLDAKTNKLRPLGYYSARLDAAQQNYSPTERELWGLVASSRK